MRRHLYRAIATGLGSAAAALIPAGADNRLTMIEYVMATCAGVVAGTGAFLASRAPTDDPGE